MRFKFFRSSAFGVVCLATSVGFAQTTPPPQTPPQTQVGGNQATPPPKLNTPDVKIPPPLTLPGVAQTDVGLQPLTIEEAVQIALRKQPQVNIAKANVLSAQGRVQQAVSGLLPQFSANAGYQRETAIRGSSGTAQDPFSASLSVQQLLFDFGRTRDQVRQQDALEQSSKWTLTRTQQNAAMQVRSAYFDLVQARANVRLSEEDVQTRQKELDQANGRMNSGLGAPSDVLQAKTGLADAVVSLSSARNTELNSQVALAQLMGINPRTPISPATGVKEDPVPNEGDIEKLVGAAMSDRPDIKSAKQQVSAAGFAVSVARKGILPRIDAVGGLVGRGNTDPFRSETATYGVAVTWQFGDGGLTAGKVKEARGSEEVARQTLIDVTNQAISDVSQAFVDLQAALQRFDTARVGVENARELVRVMEGRYMGGIGQFLDVTSAENSLNGAQHSLSQARADVNRARVRLKAAIGQL